MCNTIKTVLLALLVGLFVGCGGCGGGGGSSDSPSVTSDPVIIKGKVGTAEFIAASAGAITTSLSTLSADATTSDAVVLASSTSELTGRIDTGSKTLALTGFYDSDTNTFSIAATSADGKYVEISGSYSGGGTITSAEATGTIGISGTVTNAEDVTVKIDDTAEDPATGDAAGLPSEFWGKWYDSEDSTYNMTVSAFSITDESGKMPLSNFSGVSANKVDKVVIKQGAVYCPISLTLSNGGNTLTIKGGCAEEGKGERANNADDAFNLSIDTTQVGISTRNAPSGSFTQISSIPAEFQGTWTTGGSTTIVVNANSCSKNSGEERWGNVQWVGRNSQGVLRVIVPTTPTGEYLALNFTYSSPGGYEQLVIKGSDWIPTVEAAKSPTVRQDDSWTLAR